LKGRAATAHEAWILLTLYNEVGRGRSTDWLQERAGPAREGEAADADKDVDNGFGKGDRFSVHELLIILLRERWIDQAADANGRVRDGRWEITELGQNQLVASKPSVLREIARRAESVKSGADTSKLVIRGVRARSAEVVDHERILTGWLRDQFATMQWPDGDAPEWAPPESRQAARGRRQEALGGETSEPKRAAAAGDKPKRAAV
jgi:hypothetical protein